MDYENILEQIGGCGRFQKIAFVFLSLSTFKLAIDIESLVFFTYTPKFSCSYPWNDTVSNETCQLDEKFGFNQTKCLEWTYDDSVLRKTMVTEFNLVCDQSFLAPLCGTLMFGGSIIGMMIGGLGDIIGRRKLLLIQAVWDASFTIILVFLPGLQWNLALRFFKGFAAGIYYNGLTYILEIVSAKYRMNLGSNYWLLWCLGYVLCGGIGKLLKDWRWIQVFSAFCSIAYIPYFIILPESPRWLFLNGRKEEATQVLKKIARWNGRRFELDSLIDIKIKKEKSGRFWEMFSSRWMTIKTLISWVILWACACAYMGMSLHATLASDDIFINMVIMGVIEIPASPFTWLFSDKFGRRLSIFITTIVTSICLYALPFIPNNLSWIRIILASLGKFALTSAYITADIWISECFPTSLRSLGLYTSSMWSNIAFMVAPYILILKDPYPWLPEIILASQTLLVLISPLFLPETTDMPLLQTVEEADLFIRGKEYLIHERLKELNDTRDKDNIPLKADVVDEL